LELLFQTAPAPHPEQEGDGQNLGSQIRNEDAAVAHLVRVGWVANFERGPDYGTLVQGFETVSLREVQVADLPADVLYPTVLVEVQAGRPGKRHDVAGYLWPVAVPSSGRGAWQPGRARQDI
jgi:hypothetical protein